MAARTFQHPVWLIGTEEERRAEEERQNLARASFTRAKQTEAERLVGRGVLLEQTARQNLLTSKGKDKESRILAENQLADALAMQGRYHEAANVHNDRHRRKHFREIVKAIERPDDERCKCKDDILKAGDVELAVTPRFERAKVFSPLHNDLISLVECSKCGHANARPLRSRLVPQQAALKQNEAVARSADRKGFIPDVEVLSK